MIQEWADWLDGLMASEDLQIPKYDYVQEEVRERKCLRNLESILKWGIAKYWIGSYNIIL